MTALVEAVRVTKIFTSGLVQRTTTVALEDFSLSLDPERPSITGIVGESGSGKSTMARLLLGLERPTSGVVLYRGKDLRTLNREDRRRFRREVQVVFQDPFGTYNSFYKVDHVLEVPIAKFQLASSASEARALMEQTLQTLGLRPAETLGRYPHQLSGGQRQRLMVARALLLRPKVIIADEPVSMIDASLRATVLDTLRQLHDEFGISLIYITHDLTTAYQISQNLVVLYNGTVAEAGDVELVVKKPRHPYTQLLVSSIPLPDPDRQWSDEPAPSPVGALAKPGIGCKFAPRCPYAFEPCVETAPPLYQSDGRRAATCYLQMEQPVVPWEEMDQLLEPNGAEIVTAPDPKRAMPAI